jgi:hypothetical protein
LSPLIFSRSSISAAGENAKTKRLIKFKLRALNKARQHREKTLKTVSADLNMSLDTIKEVLLWQD